MFSSTNVHGGSNAQADSRRSPAGGRSSGMFGAHHRRAFGGAGYEGGNLLRALCTGVEFAVERLAPPGEMARQRGPAGLATLSNPQISGGFLAAVGDDFVADLRALVEAA